VATRVGVDVGGAFADLDAVQERLAELAPVLGAHAGGTELVDVDGGVVRLRFTGMCRGCHLRPLTTASTIRPALLALAGVTAVEVEGSRISVEAEARLAAALARTAPRPAYTSS
jgi:Fe-S cluster biogenesis protein NfuA